MTDQYTGRARITNKQTGASREGVVTSQGYITFSFEEEGHSQFNTYVRAEFTVEPLLPEIPSEPGDTFTAEVTRGGYRSRVMLMASGTAWWWSHVNVEGFDLHNAEHIDRATIESVITAKERGL